MKYKFGRKSRAKRLVAFALVLGMGLSMAGCGKEAKDSRPRAKSIFEFFDSEPDTEDPWSTEQSTEPGTGDVIVDPPVIDPPTADPNKYSDTENEELNKLFKEFFDEGVTSSSISFRNYIKDGKNFGLRAPSPATLGDPDREYTEEGFMEDKKEVEDWISRLEAIDVNTLTEQQRFDYDYLLDNLKSSLVTYENVYIGGDFSPMSGVQGNLPSVFTDWIFESKEDIQLYIDVMKLYPPEVDKALEFEKLRVEKGYGYEDCVIDKIISQCDEFLNQTGENFLITVFNEQIDGFAGVTDAERADFKKQNEEAVTNYLVPMYQRIKDTFTGLKGTNKIKGGLCNFEEHGAEIYAYLVREYTGSTKTPEQMIAYVDQAINNIRTRMDTMYLTDTNAYLYFISNETTLFNYMSNMTAEEVVNDLMNRVMGDYPDIGKINYQALYFDKSMEKMKENTLAYYMIPPIDDKDGNLIRVNGAHKDDMWITLAHEGCPGHMYQTNYYKQTNPQNFRFIGTELGYIEGWAVYASYESLKYCDFNGSEYAEQLRELAAMDEQLGYLIQGRIDLGIHVEGWTVSDIENFLSKNGMNASAAERIYTFLVGNPALYLSYSVGYMEMKDLRDYAEDELGDKFNVVEYHRTVLDAGPCKYDQLKKRVDKYILETK